MLQRSHIVTGDDAHYVAVIQELEYRGARVLPIFCGGLDFSKPVNEFYYDSINKDQPIVDGVVSLTGFALVGGQQDKIILKLLKPKKVKQTLYGCTSISLPNHTRMGR